MIVERPAAGVAPPRRLGQIRFASLQPVVRAPAILDVDGRTVPSNDVPLSIAPRQGAGEKPAILTVGSAHSELMLGMVPGRPSRGPPGLSLLDVVRMDRGHQSTSARQPGPRGATEIGQPPLIY